MSEQAVLLHIGTLPGNIGGLDEIEDPLRDAIEATSVGEVDGNEIGAEGAVIYMYGPDADALWSTIEPVVAALGLQANSFATKRYGPPGAPETTVTLG